jgi:hypothetical protein
MATREPSTTAPARRSQPFNIDIGRRTLIGASIAISAPIATSAATPDSGLLQACADREALLNHMSDRRERFGSSEDDLEPEWALYRELNERLQGAPCLSRADAIAKLKHLITLEEEEYDFDNGQGLIRDMAKQMIAYLGDV